MIDVINLALPFFGLILLGFFCGRLMKMPEAGLAWMNFYIVYVALPPLFFKLIVATPFAELQNWSFVVGTTLSTYLVFVLSLAIGLAFYRGDLKPATLQAVLGAYSNIGYMGPGLTLAAIGPKAAAPTALIFVFDNILLFSLIPFLMALGGTEKLDVARTARMVLWKIVSHPFNIAAFVALIFAYFQLKPPMAIDRMLTMLYGSAAPVALFALGLTVASRRVTRVPVELPIHLCVKLFLHPAIILLLLSLLGPFEKEWVYSAVLMASLPPALNVFVVARQYDVYVQEASTAILLGTLASIVSLTFVLYLITTGALPISLFG
ncbi:MAG TPA: AEC family transporter [Beijerinckiaceae bacterium]|nr:AEC family transporter [Beijerinckiaceae bacterium]